MTPPEQARAARLTAIAEQACNGSKGPGQIEFEIEELIAAHVETLTQQVAELTATNAALSADLNDSLRNEASLEQQRDAAHAALKKWGRHKPDCDSRYGEPPPCTCGLDAALAASAPQKEEE